MNDEEEFATPNATARCVELSVRADLTLALKETHLSTKTSLRVRACAGEVLINHMFLRSSRSVINSVKEAVGDGS